MQETQSKTFGIVCQSHIIVCQSHITVIPFSYVLAKALHMQETQFTFSGDPMKRELGNSTMTKQEMGAMMRQEMIQGLKDHTEEKLKAYHKIRRYSNILSVILCLAFIIVMVSLYFFTDLFEPPTIEKMKADMEKEREKK